MELKGINKKIDKSIEEVVEFADASLVRDHSQLLEHVFANPRSCRIGPDPRHRDTQYSLMVNNTVRRTGATSKSVAKKQKRSGDEKDLESTVDIVKQFDESYKKHVKVDNLHLKSAHEDLHNRVDLMCKQIEGYKGDKHVINNYVIVEMVEK